MNFYALAVAVVGVAIAVEADSAAVRALGSIAAGVAGSALLRPHIDAVGNPGPAPQTVGYP